jgi:acyl transferase domain-containing protein
VAIVGMAGKFPGARTVGELWRNLVGGKETVARFTDAELDPDIPAEQVRDPRYVKARGVLEDIDQFDAAFFGITPKEAALMDPQQRLILEVAWETLESAGHVPESYPGTIGVFAGKYNDSYYAENVVTRPDLIAELGAFQVMVGNEKDYVATRIAHRLDLKGPALSVHTACSTSLVAVVVALQSLESGQCDLALAGGSSLTVPVKSGHVYQEGSMLSSDGSTRTFDASATGTVFSDGVAMVALKRLDDAIADGDTIYGVIRGGAMTNDGGARASFTAPSVEGQARVVAMAHAAAGVDPRDISYVEAHGTATPLGDPIEVEALTQAFRLRTQDRNFCGIGSVKSNVGHLVIAAGATGLIKTALALTHKLIPATLHYRAPNPKLDFGTSPFYVIDKLTPWPEGRGLRLAGVSAFGVGGTNAHVVVEEPPALVDVPSSRSSQLLVLSARSEAAVDAAAERLAAHLEGDGAAQPLADVAFTLHAGRKAFPFRRVVVGGNGTEIAAALRARDPKRVLSRKAPPTAPEVVFMFPGQGSQYPGMGARLYAEHATFRLHVEECLDALPPSLAERLHQLVFDPAGAEHADVLRQTAHAQPALFIVEYALARLWQSWGLTPKALLGTASASSWPPRWRGSWPRPRRPCWWPSAGSSCRTVRPAPCCRCGCRDPRSRSASPARSAWPSRTPPTPAWWPARPTRWRPSRRCSRPSRSPAARSSPRTPSTRR